MEVDATNQHSEHNTKHEPDGRRRGYTDDLEAIVDDLEEHTVKNPEVAVPTDTRPEIPESQNGHGRRVAEPPD